MRSNELELLAASIAVLGTYCFAPLCVAGLVWWVATRSRRARVRGMMAMGEGRLVEALSAFELCEDKLLLKGQAQLWLWRLGQAIADLEGAISFNPPKYEDQAAPYIALATALRNDRDVDSWLLRSMAGAPGSASEARLAAAVMAARKGAWADAVGVMQSLMFTNVRARALRDALQAWALTMLDGQPRSVDAASLLGEGSITDLEQGFPAFAAVLRAGRTG